MGRTEWPRAAGGVSPLLSEWLFYRKGVEEKTPPFGLPPSESVLGTSPGNHENPSRAALNSGARGTVNEADQADAYS